MGSNSLSFCDKESWMEIAVAFAVTYTPLGIFSLKVAKGSIGSVLNFFIFVICCFTFVYLCKHHSTSNNLVLSLGALTSLLWGVYVLYGLITWLIVRCRLCCLGRSYILAPPYHVAGVDGRQPLTSSADTAFVVRKPGATLVNGQLVPDFNQIVLGGRKASHKGVVSLTKYA